MKPCIRAVLFAGAILVSLTFSRAASVSWDGGGGDNSWQTAANWNNDVLPGPNDDVVINGAGEVTLSTGFVTVRSVQSARGLTLSGGTLNLTGGASVVQGAFSLKSGALSVQGNGTTLTVNGPTTQQGANVSASGGAVVNLSKLVSIATVASGDLKFEAFDPGSRIDLPTLTDATVADFYHFRLYASSGGRISAPKLNSVTGALDAFAANTGSVIDLTGFQGTMVNTSRGEATIEARDGASILMPNVTEVENVEIVLRDDGMISTSQLKSIKGASLTIDGQINNFPALTNLVNTSLHVEGDAQVVLLGIRQLIRTNSGHLTVSARNPGSVLELPNLTEATVQNFYRFQIMAYDGGEVRLPKLTRLNGAIDVHGEGDNSRISLNGFQGGLTNSTSGAAYIEVRDGAIINMPGVTSLDRIDLTLRGTGEISNTQLISFTDATLSVEGKAANFPALTNISGSSVTVSSGGQLVLDRIAQLRREKYGNLRYQVEGAGSVMNFPNVTEVSVTDFYQLELFAYSGGLLRLPKLGKITGALDVISDGLESEVNLPAFVGTLSNTSPGLAYIEARNKGKVEIPAVKALSRINLTQRSGGEVSTSQLTSLNDALISLDNTTGNFASMTNLGGSSISLQNKAVLALPGVTGISRTNNGNVTFTVSDSGSVLTLANLLRAEVRDFYQFELFVYAGGRINLPWLSGISGSLDVYADGNGSNVDLSGLAGTLGNTGSAAAYIEARNGGAVLLPNITALDKFNVILRGTGTIPTAQLSSIRNSTVVVDGRSVDFSSLADTAGTTFSYINGGTAVFQTPTDIIVSSIRVPATITANQPTEIVWEITNIGTVFTNGLWTDNVYLSLDAVPGGDEFLGSVQSSGGLASGGKRMFTNQITIPARLAGVRYIVVSANSSRSLFEGTNYANNTNISAAVTVLAPDLIVQNPSIQPTSTQFGKTVTLNWTVKNSGTSGASGSWIDRITLAKNAADFGNSIVLTNVASLNALAAGESYTRAATVTIPLLPDWEDGNYFFQVQADYSGAIAEGIETNNSISIPVTLARPPLPDLAIDRVQMPSTALPGDLLELVWVTTNKGTAPAGGVWTERIALLSANGANTNQILSDFIFTNNLPIGGTLVRTQRVTLPQEARAGSARILVSVDVENQVAEKNETNNVFVSLQSMTVEAMLTMNLPVKSISEGSANPTFSALISRNGDTSVPLSVSVNSSDPKELAAPANVTIRAGEASALLPLTVQRDGIPDSNKDVNITVSASGYSPAQGVVTVMNEDIPKLTVQLSVADLLEGQGAQLTISHDGQFVVPITVNLTATGNGQVILPDRAIIPAGQNSVIVEMRAEDDTRIEPDRTYTIQAAAPGFTSGRTDVRIRDNDLVQFTFSVASTNISENAGPQATLGTISRGVASPRSLVVELESSNPNAVLVPRTITIPGGATTFTFPIAAVDNSAVDGVKIAIIRAFALATDSGERIAQTAPVSINVLDDDGPTLSVAISNELAGEGVANAATVTVTRNTAPTQPVVVNLFSSVTTEATVPATITIPLGATSATATLSTKDDGIADGSKTVLITATAVGYTSGSASIVVTDLNQPDLVVKDLSVPDSAETEAFVNIGYRIYNQGLSVAGTNWATRAYLSEDSLIGKDTLLNEYSFQGNLPVGQFFGQTRQVRMPKTPGKYWLVVQTDSDSQINEILENNNTSISRIPIVVSAAYTATVVADVKSAPAGTSIPMHGTAVRASTGGLVPFTLVNIHINLRGIRRVISALTDESGRFAAVFKPLPGEAGFYEIGAAHPGLSAAPVQDNFSLHGLKADKIDFIRLSERTSVSGQVMIENLGERALTQLSVTVSNQPANLQITTTVSTNALSGFGNATIGFAITANDATIPEGILFLRTSTAQGASVAIPIAFQIDSLRPRLIVNPSELIQGMKVGGQTIIQFDVINEGGVATGPLNVSLPNMAWMRLATPNPLPSLPPHSSNRVTLQLTPAANLALGAYEGLIAVNATNASVQVPYNIRALSEAKGDLLITAVDEYTYFAEGSPKVAGATVLVRDAVNLQVVTNGVTDANGRYFLSGIPEGYYELELKADKHTSYRQPHLFLSGKTNEVNAFLRREAVRYIWSVIPTEIQDRTRITIETVFEAFVPMPVITVEPPLIDLADFTAEVTQIDLKVMNHGLITAKEASIGFAEHPDWSIEPLVEELGDIPARGSFTVPVLIRKLTPGLQRQSGRMRAMGGGGCNITGGCRFVVECGGSKLAGSADVPVINASASGNCGGGGGGRPGGSGSSSGGAPGGGGGSPGSSSASIGTCDKCLLSLLTCAIDLAMPDVGSCAKDLYGCQSAIRSGDGGQTAYGCMKAFINCAAFAGKETLGKVGKAIDIAECLNGIIPDCFGGGGGGGGAGGSETGLVGTLARQSQRAAEAQGVSRVQRGETAIVFERLEWVLDEVSPFRYVMGDDIWFRNGEAEITASWVRAFVQRVELGTEAGGRVSASELTQLLALKLPKAITIQQARAFVERWNRSLDYWAREITSEAQVPSGENPDFIALDTLRIFSTASNDSFNKSEAAGYESPDIALTQSRQELIRFMSEGDGGGVCAHVRLRLDQEAVQTRDAFDASLEIVNDSDETLENVSIQLAVHTRTGQDATELFAIRAPILKDINAIDGTGRVSANSAGTISWTVIPTTDAARNGPEEFLISGTLRYRQNGQLNITVPLAPATITVLPSPSLAVKYFHERQVFADDPFTVEIEPSIPYSLAVMVENKGRGIARNVHIDSAQPKIVENEKGLFADFKIIATQVETENLMPSLSVNFGQLNPNTNVIGRWLFTSTILGGFIDYTATFEHLDGLGNKKLSLVEGVEIRELIHIVRATGSADDGRPDFLVNDIPDLYDRPDTLHLSDGSVQPVSVVLEGSTDRQPTTSQLNVQLTASMPAGWTYLRVSDPGKSKFRLNRVVRSNGIEIPRENVWTTDRTFLGNARRPVVESMIHIFDRDSTGSYTLSFLPPLASDEVAPTSSVAPIPEDSAARFPVTWSGQDNAGGRGISFYDIYVSVDNGPFSIWIAETIDRSAIYQGGLSRTYAFYSIATDQAGNRETAPLTADARTTVTRTNHAPTLQLISDRVIREGETLVIQPIATDEDGDELIFSLHTNAPPGILINPYTGKITWVTSEGSGPKNYQITVQVLDSGLPRLGATRTFVVTVTDENTPPIISPIPDRSISEGQLLTFTAVASDSDLPKQTISYALLAGAPVGATIQANSGLFAWRPTDYQGGVTYPIGIIAQDNGSPGMSSTQMFKVTVRDTRSDLIVALGTTNVLASGTATVPINLTSGGDLREVTFELIGMDDHIESIVLMSPADEVISSVIEFSGEGRNRIRIELDSARAKTGTREIGRLQVSTSIKGRSSAAALNIQGMRASRQNGEIIASVSGLGGRVFIIENEPMLDTCVSGPGFVRLVIYAKVGTQLSLESNSDLGKNTNWGEATGLTMSTTFHVSQWPILTNGPVFFRALKNN